MVYHVNIYIIMGFIMKTIINIDLNNIIYELMFNKSIFKCSHIYSYLLYYYTISSIYIQELWTTKSITLHQN